MNLDTLTVYIASTLHFAVPLMLAASGELVSEVAGVLNLSLEGMMLFAAFFAIWGTSVTGSAWVGLLCGIGSGVIFSVLQALLSVRLRANQLVVGIGLNILALGATTFLNREIFGALSRDLVPGFGTLYIPGLSALPIIGPSLFQQYDVVYVGIALIALIWFVLRFTAYGVECRAVGDDPRAADWAGISVLRVRVMRDSGYRRDGWRRRHADLGRRHPHLHRRHDQRRRLSGDCRNHLRRLAALADGRGLHPVRRSDGASIPVLRHRFTGADCRATDAALCAGATLGRRPGRAAGAAGRTYHSIPRRPLIRLGVASNATRAAPFRPRFSFTASLAEAPLRPSSSTMAATLMRPQLRCKVSTAGVPTGNLVLCVAKIGFCSIDDEGRRGRVVI